MNRYDLLSFRLFGVAKFCIFVVITYNHRAMKILHTSDWHLGHTLYNYDCTEEQLSMLRQMRTIVDEERPDLFLLSGDVYHTSRPSAAVQTMLADALMSIHEACPDMIIVVTAGNHDSGMRHEIFRTPWRRLNVHMIGTIDRERPESHIVEIPGKGYVVALPYAYGRFISDGFLQSVLEHVGEMNDGRQPVVVSAHTTVKGCDITGHDGVTEYTVGGIDYVTIDEFGCGYDYLALGHIHRQQWIHGSRGKARYCGTPLAVSFDEAYDHSVSIVTVNGDGEPPVLKTVAVDNPFPLVTLPASGAAEWERVKELLSEFPADIPAYIRLNVSVDGFLPVGAMNEALLIASGKKCKVCHINTVRRDAVSATSRMMSVSDFRMCQPVEIAGSYAADIGAVFDDDMKAMFNEALDEVKKDERND